MAYKATPTVRWIVTLMAVLVSHRALAAAATCGAQGYDDSQYYCLNYLGDKGQPALCPKSAPCACPTPAALAVHGAPYGCYSPQQYHCDAAQLEKAQNGLVSGPGVSTAGACPHTGNLITNGGFETGDFTNWTIESNQGSSAVTTDPHSGKYAATLSAATDGYLIQVVNTPATKCSLSFYLKGYQPRPSTAYFRVAFDGADYTGDLVNEALLSSVGTDYTLFFATFTGYGHPARLVFPYKWGDYSGHYWALDDVSIYCSLF